MDELYPLCFRPILRQYIWGGRRLETLLGKKIGPENDYAESWEICDHGTDQSIVENGPLAGMTLAELVTDRGDELLGRHHPQSHFPLLLKFLDASRTLSVQVHPDDARAARIDPPDLGKSEAWIVLVADPGATIYAGLKPGVDRRRLAASIQQGTCQDCLHQFQPKPGDCVYLPAGTVHALGEGLMVVEIQQASDTTYRLFDWNRVGSDGNPRELHIQQGLEAIDFDLGPVDPQTPQPTGRKGVSRLVSGDKFILDRWRFDAVETVGGDRQCHILCVLEGAMRLEGYPDIGPLGPGRSVMLPACLDPIGLIPDGTTVLLDTYLP